MHERKILPKEQKQCHPCTLNISDKRKIKQSLIQNAHNISRPIFENAGIIGISQIDLAFPNLHEPGLIAYELELVYSA